MWEYYFNGDVIARLRRSEDEQPYLGMPVCMVGRTGKLAPAENFVVTWIDASERQLALGYAQ